MSRRLDAFRELCSNASDNKLIKVALDEEQKAEYNGDSDVHKRCAQIASEEMERRGLDAALLNGANEDTDFDKIA
jgi:hypothetical protein